MTPGCSMAPGRIGAGMRTCRRRPRQPRPNHKQGPRQAVPLAYARGSDRLPFTPSASRDSPSGEYPLHRARERIGTEIRRTIGLAFLVLAVDQHGAATGGGAGLDIAPAVANQETPAEVDSVPSGGFQQQAGLGLPAGAGIGIVVPADQKTVYGQRGPDGRVDGFHHPARHAAARYIGLVGDYDQQVAGLLAPGE